MKQLSKLKFSWLIVIAVTGIFALVLQLYLIIVNNSAAAAVSIIQYLSYFTIQSNVLVTACAAVLLLAPTSPAGKFFSNVSTFTALTLYITIVGLVYNLILRPIWNPHGLQKLVDEMLHVIIPLAFLVYWIIFVPKRQLTWNIWLWLIYPFLYAVYIMIRGALTAKYPYPFLDVAQLGYSRVLVNIGGMVLVFLFFALLFTGIGKLSAKRSS